MKQGILFYDEVSERYDFKYDTEQCYGGLHCGEGFEVLLNGSWVHTRIEYDWDSNQWYLVGLKGISLPGLDIRME